MRKWLHKYFCESTISTILANAAIAMFWTIFTLKSSNKALRISAVCFIFLTIVITSLRLKFSGYNEFDDEG